MTKSALVYDRINKVGGAEEVLKALKSIYDAPLYTSVYKKSSAPFAKGWDIRPSFLNSIPFLAGNHELVPFLMPFIFEYFTFDEYDLVISVSSAEAKGIITRPETLHINYCLTPTRYLWSHKEEYLESGQFGAVQKLLRPLIAKVLEKLSMWDYTAAQRPDVMIAISEHVKKRVKKYYDREVDVIYPPVSTGKFGKKSSFKPKHKDYYLSVGRLVPYKKIDTLIKACNKAGKDLVIVGVGAQMKALKKIAGDTIHFMGHVKEEELIGYYQNCKAFLQVNEEDFGISMVEAQAAGKPVIAYNKGGASEIVTKKTGILLETVSERSLLQAFDKLEKMPFVKSDCTMNAKRFDEEVFKKQFKEKVSEWQKKKEK